MKVFVPFLCALICLFNMAPGVRSQEKKDLDALLKDLDSKDREIRLAAVMALADLGPDAGKAAKALAEFLTAKDADLQLNAAIALGKIGKEAVTPVAKLLGSKETDT